MNINVVAIFKPKAGSVSAEDITVFQEMVDIAKINSACIKYEISNLSTYQEDNRVILTEEWTVLDEENFNSPDKNPEIFLNLSKEHVEILGKLQETFNLSFA